MKYLFVLLLFIPIWFSGMAQVSPSDVVDTKDGPLTVQPIQHASLILTINGLTIYVDPSGANNFKGMKAPDMILITDIHGDHFDIKTIDALKQATTWLIVPQVVADKLPDGDK